MTFTLGWRAAVSRTCWHWGVLVCSIHGCTKVCCVVEWCGGDVGTPGDHSSRHKIKVTKGNGQKHTTSSFVLNGFSHRTCFPASIALIVCSACTVVTVATQTASSPSCLSISSYSVYNLTPQGTRFSLAHAISFSSGVNAATSSALGVRCRKWFAWRAPMRPRPETATRSLRTGWLIVVSGVVYVYVCVWGEGESEGEGIGHSEEVLGRRAWFKKVGVEM